MELRGSRGVCGPDAGWVTTQRPRAVGALAQSSSRGRDAAAVRHRIWGAKPLCGPGFGERAPLEPGCFWVPAPCPQSPGAVTRLVLHVGPLTHGAAAQRGKSRRASRVPPLRWWARAVRARCCSHPCGLCGQRGGRREGAEPSVGTWPSTAALWGSCGAGRRSGAGCAPAVCWPAAGRALGRQPLAGPCLSVPPGAGQTRGAGACSGGTRGGRAGRDGRVRRELLNSGFLVPTARGTSRGRPTLLPECVGSARSWRFLPRRSPWGFLEQRAIPLAPRAMLEPRPAAAARSGSGGPRQ